MDSEHPEAAGPAAAAACTPATAAASPTPACGDAGHPGAGDQAAPLTPGLTLQIRAFESLRYHEDRQGFFESASRWSNFFIVVAGSGAASAGLAQHPGAAALAGAASAVFGAAQLVFDLAGKARTHLELRKAFVGLLADASRPHAEAADLEVALINLCAEEPEIHWAVDALAYNAAQLRFGRPANTLLLVTGWQRLMRHLLRFDPSQFRDVDA